ncbi:MAG TPA: hypothetical protein VHE37_12415 [Nevskiaceae bacterium]|nr:hypothetical protein [Nevskiaceae bacterium]
MTKLALRGGFRRAAAALLLALGARVAWWSTQFDPLMLLGYAIIVTAMMAMFVLFNEIAEARQRQQQVQELHEDAATQQSQPDRVIFPNR